MNQNVVWNAWHDGEISDSAVYRDLVETKDARAPTALQSFESLQKRRRALDLEQGLLWYKLSCVNVKSFSELIP